MSEALPIVASLSRGAISDSLTWERLFCQVKLYGQLAAAHQFNSS